MKTLPLFFAAMTAAIFSCTGFAQSVTITATDANAAETLAGQAANPGGIRIARTGSTASALTVWVRVQGLATQLDDYTFGTFIGTTVVIPAGSASVDIVVNPIDDFLTEGIEDVRIRLEAKTDSGANVPYTISGSDRAIVNISDNEDPLAPPRAILTIAAVDALGTETAGGTDPAVFRITRTNNLAPALNILYALGGTATPGVDYAALPATITMPAGAASVDVTIAPIDDTLIEEPEGVTFTLLPTDVTGSPLPATAYALGPLTTAGATIVSDDLPPAPTVAITAPGAGAAAQVGHAITIAFTASVSDGTIVSYYVTGDWGASGVGGVTNLPASTPAGTPYSGSGSVTIGTAYATSHVSVTVVASNGRMATSAPISVWGIPPLPPLPPAPSVPTINIYALDADGAEISTASGLPQQPASFRVTHNFPPTATVSFLFAIGGTAREGVDYTLSSAGTLTGGGFFGRSFTFPPGATQTTILVNAIDDQLVESTETVFMSLYVPPFIGYFDNTGPFDWVAEFGFHFGVNDAAIVSIHDNDIAPPPFPVITIAATDASGTETTDGSDPIVFTITRISGPTNVPLTVSYGFSAPPYAGFNVVTPRGAQSGPDFSLPGTVTIPAGATTADIVLVPTYDRLLEGDETAIITLLPSATAWPDPTAYVVDADITTSAIIHDAPLAAGASLIWLFVSDALATHSAFPGREGSFQVRRSGDLSQALTVPYAVDGSATNGVDYVPLPGFVTIPAGASSVTILINPYAGSVGTLFWNPVETVVITLLPSPADSTQVPYFLGNTANQSPIGAISILDHVSISAKQLALLIRRRHLVLPIPPRRPVPLPPPALVGVAAVVAPVEMWAVEASTDLVNWEFIGNTDPSGDYGDFVDVNAGDFPSRFYRFRPITPPTP